MINKKKQFFIIKLNAHKIIKIYNLILIIDLIAYLTLIIYFFIKIIF